MPSLTNQLKAEIVKVNAQNLRKGNVVEMDGRLYVVLKAESFHPGKGTPTTQIDMRRISDGVKVSERWKTTEQVERAMLDERPHSFLYNDEEGYHFMNKESYEQITVTPDVVGDFAAYLEPEMEVQVAVYNDVAVSIEIPAKVVLEIVDTEPVTKGQTATSSYKPALLSNGVKTTVPPFITTGTRIVVLTEDGSYVERAKD